MNTQDILNKTDYADILSANWFKKKSPRYYRRRYKPVSQGQKAGYAVRGCGYKIAQLHPDGL
jgi:hypothetical protein